MLRLDSVLKNIRIGETKDCSITRNKLTAMTAEIRTFTM